MRTNNWIILICAAITCFTSCNDDKIASNTQLIKSISVTGQDFTDGDAATRAAYSVDGTGFHFSWTAGDTVGIYPVGGDQVAFPISSGEGSQTAQFDGGAWALRSSYSYAAYYPYVKSNYMVDETIIPVSYIGQTQNGNGSLDCIDRFDYQASVASKPEADGNVNITLKHLGCFVRFQLTMPVTDTYKSISLKSSKTPFITSGTFDLTKDVISITPSTTADSIKLDLSGTSTIDENKILTIYAMLAPSDLSDSKITISIEGTAYKTYEATITGKNMLAGKAYNYTATIKSGTNINGEDVSWDEQEQAEYEYVDLGLSVMWATCNVGATSEKEIGYRFAWGEVEHDKDHYDWDNYRWGDGSTFTKYYSGVDNKTKLDDEDDAAQQLLGDSWRMPTVDEIKELYENCTWEDVVENGVVVGFRGTARNSQSIYFPCNGQFDESGLQHKYTAKIWTSQCDNYYAYLLDICSSGASTISNHRHDGLCLRAVKKKPEEMRPKYEYVDLGLSVKWATFNVGASSEKEIGYRFAWGEVEHDKDHYDWDNYRWGDGSIFTKYYSGVDNKTKLDDEDDAVQKLWGDLWRMPTVEEAKELYDNCTWEEVVENGVIIGYRATAKNSNSIFFPSNGQLDEYGHENVEMVQIWTSECSGTMAYRLGKGWYGDGVTTYSERHDGLCLRAVQKNTEEIQSNYEYVDLGLSVKWATFNVGATKPEEYGDYFSWGETEAKAKYEWADYKYYSEGDSYSNIKFSKYNTLSRRGVVDNKKTLDLEDDVAHVKWGGNWRMPTKAEQEELKNNCTWTQTSVNGIVGYRVTSKKSGFNDCSIFLPLAGHRADTCLYYSDSNGFYWSSSLNLSDMCSAWYIDFNNGNLNVNSGHYRRNGFSVRPVCQ